MSFRSLVGALALGAFAMAPSAALAQAARTDDRALDTRIEASIKANETFKHDRIDVDVENGVVTLTGKVASAAHRTRAESLATITGVTRVDNRLDVDRTLGEKLDKTVAKSEKAADTAAGTTGRATNKAGSETKNAAVATKDATVKAAGKTKDGAVYVGEKTKDGAVYVGGKTKAAASATAEGVTDAWITTRLKLDFVNEDTLKNSSINVDTNDHIVTLKGTVTSEAGRARAKEIASTTKGVRRVIDNRIIAPKMTRR
jgi:hyperosmotically inducible periplasmic protein